MNMIWRADAIHCLHHGEMWKLCPKAKSGWGAHLVRFKKTLLNLVQLWNRTVQQETGNTVHVTIFGYQSYHIQRHLHLNADSFFCKNRQITLWTRVYTFSQNVGMKSNLTQVTVDDRRTVESPFQGMITTKLLHQVQLNHLKQTEDHLLASTDTLLEDLGGSHPFSPAQIDWFATAPAVFSLDAFCRSLRFRYWDMTPVHDTMHLLAAIWSNTRRSDAAARRCSLPAQVQWERSLQKTM